MTNRFQIISLYDVCDSRDVLSGLPRGLSLLGRLIQSASPQHDATVFLMDFHGIDLATSSFLRAGIVGFRDHCVKMKLNLFPVLVNLKDEIVDELREVLVPRSDAMLVGNLSSDERISNVRVVGALDAIQRLTFEAVARLGEADAYSLWAQFEDTEKISTTGWNNRLTSLVGKGLLVEIKRGRGKFYRPVLEF
jgi:hypothetical protein